MDESKNNDTDNEVKETDKKNPFVINPSNGLVIVVGLVMLLLGGFLGYYARPLVGPEAQAARKTEAANAIAIQTQVAENKKIMDYLVGELKHFQGDPNAPVTVIEFSDFQ